MSALKPETAPNAIFLQISILEYSIVIFDLEGNSLFAFHTISGRFPTGKRPLRRLALRLIGYLLNLGWALALVCPDAH